MRFDDYELVLFCFQAKKTLKNLRIRVNNNEYKITGLSDQICKDQK